MSLHCNTACYGECNNIFQTCFIDSSLQVSGESHFKFSREQQNGVHPKYLIVFTRCCKSSEVRLQINCRSCLMPVCEQVDNKERRARILACCVSFAFPNCTGQFEQRCWSRALLPLPRLQSLLAMTSSLCAC
jgi:hypothetical protein